MELLKNGKDHGVSRLYYTYQEGNAGISDALKLAAPFLDKDEECVVILGDNYFAGNIADYLSQWNKKGCMVFLKPVKKPWDFGIAEINKNKIISIEEKPSHPRSNLAILGCYMFDGKVWEYLKKIRLSDRGEMEITDVLKYYMEAKKLNYCVYNDYWLDMGTFETWVEVSQRVAQKEETE